MKEKTIKEYAKTSRIPLEKLLNDLEMLGFTCKPNDILNKEMRQKLSFKKAKETRERIKSIESEALSYAETRSAEILEQSLCNIKKIGKIIEICLNLCPENVRASCRETLGSDFVSDIFPSLFYKTLKKTLFFEGRYSILIKHKINLSEKIENDWYKLVDVDYFYGLIIPSWAINEYYANEFDSVARKNKQKMWKTFKIHDSRAFEEIKKQIEERVNEKLYTSALVSVIHYLSSSRFLRHEVPIAKYDFKCLSFIGDLLLYMKVSDSCFELYSVDNRLFQNPKSLGLLVDAAIKAGNLEKSQELLTKLIDSEPYHPSIPILKSEIKRLENRSALKVNFSIDFSKINDLTGLEFEKLLYDKFLELGFKAESTPKTGDFGADLIIENKEGTRIVVQCKRFTSKVNLKAVQEVIGAIGYYGCDIGIVITNNSFLNSAVKLAESHDIELWDGDKLVSFLAGDLTFSKIIGD